MSKLVYSLVYPSERLHDILKRWSYRLPNVNRRCFSMGQRARKLMKRLRDRAFACGSYPIYFNKPAIQQEADDGVVVERASHETF